jgi:hypothetical protein
MCELFLWCILKERGYLENLEADRNNVKVYFKERGWKKVDCIHLAQDSGMFYDILDASLRLRI